MGAACFTSYLLLVVLSQGLIFVEGWWAPLMGVASVAVNSAAVLLIARFFGRARRGDTRLPEAVVPHVGKRLT